MKMLKQALWFGGMLILLASCQLFSKMDQVEQDRRAEYKKSQSLPDLEVPPDLTILSGSEKLALPGEGPAGGTSPATVVGGAAQDQAGSQAGSGGLDAVPGITPSPPAEAPPQGQEASAGAAPATAPVLAGVSSPTLDPALGPGQDSGLSQGPSQGPGQGRGLGGTGTILAEQVLEVQAPVEELWPLLHGFWEQRGHSLELDDMEIGVMETTWLEAFTQGEAMRSRFRILRESGSAPDQHVLLLSSDNQRYLEIDASGDWLLQDRDLQIERELAEALSSFLQEQGVPVTLGTAQGIPQETAGGTARGAARLAQARIVEAAGDRAYLLIPHPLVQGWERVGNAIRGSGMEIQAEEPDKGLYRVLYHPAEDSSGEGSGGFLSSLFSSSSKEGLSYQIQLAEVGDKTEVVVLDEEGQWKQDPHAQQILALLQSRSFR